MQSHMNSVDCLCVAPGFRCAASGLRATLLFYAQNPAWSRTSDLHILDIVDQIPKAW